MNNHYREDATLATSKALPAQNNNTNGDALNLRGVGKVDVEIEVGVEAALPSLADGQTITLTVQDSADGTNFTAVPSAAPLVLTGAGGAGAAVASRRYRLPRTTREFVRVNAAASATAGNNTAVKFFLKAKF